MCVRDEALNILVTGRGSGSWQIRGVELGGAIGATVERNASRVKGYDLAVVVKRPRPDLLHRLREVGTPVVWDVVDAWPQPDGNEWDRERCLAWLRGEVETIRPAAIVAATGAMAADCAEFGVPVLALPHHGRPGQRMNPIRERAQAIGYEGGEQYLGRWREILQNECTRRKWMFHVNPKWLGDVDIVVAVRAQQGYAARNWKSGVKLANAQITGTPCILNNESGYRETKSGGELWADDATELSICLDSLAHRATRQHASAVLRSRAITLESVARTYKEWLEALRF